MEMKNYTVTKHKEGWAVIQDVEKPNCGYLRFISVHSTKYDAWKEARRLARGAGGKATLNKNVSNTYSHAEGDDV